MEEMCIPLEMGAEQEKRAQQVVCYSFEIRLGYFFSRKIGSSGDLQLTYLFSLARVFIY